MVRMSRDIGIRILLGLLAASGFILYALGIPSGRLPQTAKKAYAPTLSLKYKPGTPALYFTCQAKAINVNTVDGSIETIFMCPGNREGAFMEGYFPLGTPATVNLAMKNLPGEKTKRSGSKDKNERRRGKRYPPKPGSAFSSAGFGRILRILSDNDVDYVCAFHRGNAIDFRPCVEGIRHYRLQARADSDPLVSAVRRGRRRDVKIRRAFTITGVDGCDGGYCWHWQGSGVYVRSNH